MTSDWLAVETDTHQDHVIAHVIGATVLGYFIADEAAYILLDIGFIWIVYVDGQMGLVPQSVAISELDLDEDAKARLLADAHLMRAEGRNAVGLTRFASAPVDCLITEVCFYAQGERRRILIKGEEASIVIETCPATGEVSLSVSLTRGEAA